MITYGSLLYLNNACLPQAMAPNGPALCIRFFAQNFTLQNYPQFIFKMQAANSIIK